MADEVSGEESSSNDDCSNESRSSHPPRKKINRGEGWDHFDKIYNKEGSRIKYARCHICKNDYTIGLQTRLTHQ